MTDKQMNDIIELIDNVCYNIDDLERIKKCVNSLIEQYKEDEEDEEEGIPLF